MINDDKGPILHTLALNDIQREAVSYVSGPELVFAGAGTGKTRVLTAKIAFLIDIGFPPSHILAVTFTNKAAREMRERVEKFISAPVSSLWIGTFHSICAKILRREAKLIGYQPGFTIYDTSDQLSVVKKLMAALNIDDRTMPPKYLLGAISARKSSCITPDECEKQANSFRDRELANFYRAYQKALKDRQAMDFDDLITNTVYMLRKDESLLAKYQSIFQYVLVDEYQDTNRAQFFLVHLLSKGHGNIFAVGDDDQSIYGWRGAMIENILSFEKEFPNTKIFKLEENYRSTTAILNFANAAIKPNRARAQKELWTSRAAGVQVKVNRFRDDRQEAGHVATGCEALLQKMPGTDIAVLFRTNAQSRVFEEAFRKKRIPYVLVGGTSFYERAEIKDCMAYMRLLVNPKDDVSFERIMNVPARSLGDKARDSLTAFAREKGVSLLQAVMAGHAETLGARAQKGFADLREMFELLAQSVENGDKPTEVLSNILRESGYMDMLVDKAKESEEEASRVENVNELMNALTAWQDENVSGTIANFLEEVSLASDLDGWERNDNAVNFMTLHTAKGLEFRAVFLVGVEDGIIPSRQNFEDESKIEEERRLFYVGCTRAMDTLECCYADQRFRFGNIQPSEPSRFLADIPKELYSFESGTRYFGAPSGGAGQGQYGAASKTGYGQASGQRRSGPSSTSSSYKKKKYPEPDPETTVVLTQRVVQTPRYDEFLQESEPQYRMGQKVTHKTFGRGTIVGISGFGGDTQITVLFHDGARKKLMAKFAKLE